MSRRNVVLIVVAGIVAYFGINYAFGAQVRRAEQAEAVADSAFREVEYLGEKLRDARERTRFVSDSLRVVAEGLGTTARLASSRADSLALELQEKEVEFREVLPLSYRAEFDAIIAGHVEVERTLRISLEAERALSRTLEQALNGAELQLELESSAQESLRRALDSSRAEADAWKKAAKPGFLKRTWGHLPWVAAGVLAGVVVSSRGGG